MLGLNKHRNLLEKITYEIDAYKIILTTPTAISSFEDYKYHVGLIKGLETAREIFNEHLIEIDKND